MSNPSNTHNQLPGAPNGQPQSPDFGISDSLRLAFYNMAAKTVELTAAVNEYRLDRVTRDVQTRQHLGLVAIHRGNFRTGNIPTTFSTPEEYRDAIDDLDVPNTQSVLAQYTDAPRPKGLRQRAYSRALDRKIRNAEISTIYHLREVDNHGGGDTTLADRGIINRKLVYPLKQKSRIRQEEEKFRRGLISKDELHRKKADIKATPDLVESPQQKKIRKNYERSHKRLVRASTGGGIRYPLTIFRNAKRIHLENKRSSKQNKVAQFRSKSTALLAKKNPNP